MYATELTSERTKHPSLRARFARWFIILLKSAKLLKAIKAIKLLKVAKPFVTLGTMAISTIVYAAFLGPWFAIGLVLMLFIHEMGHVWAMKFKGMETRAPVFIPMLGAVIFCPPFTDRRTEAFVGYGGPLVGSLAGLALFGIWALIPGRPEILLLISYIAIFLNLFNMLPIRPLDGGRITQVTGSWFKYLGVIILLALTLAIKQPGVLLIWILVLSDFKMDYTLRAGLGVVCWVSMIGLMVAGYSDQGLLADGVDVVLAGLFNGILFIEALAARRGGQTMADIQDALPQAPLKSRVLWLVLYLVLAGLLVAAMLYQVPFLPAEVH